MLFRIFLLFKTNASLYTAIISVVSKTKTPKTKTKDLEIEDLGNEDLENEDPLEKSTIKVNSNVKCPGNEVDPQMRLARILAAILFQWFPLTNLPWAHCAIMCVLLAMNLASAIPAVSSATFRSFLGSRDYPPIILQLSDFPHELKNVCSMFPPRKAPGYDNISMREIKHSFHLISEPLVNIINLSLSKGIFPEKLKIGKAIPFFFSFTVECVS